MITQIGIEKFKCFQDKQIFKLSNLNIFAGMNGRGKSTVFQSLLLLAQSLKKKGNIETLCTNGEFVKLSHFEDLINFSDKEDDKKFIRFEIDTDNPDYHPIIISYKKDGDWNGRICELKVTGNDYFKAAGSLESDENITNTPVLQSTYPQMDKIFSPFYYISASRLGPTLYEEKCEEEPFNPLGILGEKRLAVLKSHTFLNDIRFDAKSKKDTTLLEEVNKWSNYIMGGAEYEIRATDNTLQLFMKNRSSMQKWASSINMGFGYSYILSIIIIALIAEKGSVVFVENPEAHLHPMAQSRLMELLSKLAMCGVQVNIETHSDHILNSIRLFCLKDEMEISNNNVSIYFFDENFQIHPLKLDSNGQIENWPKGFFDLQEQQLMEILRLGLLKQ